MFDCTLYCPDCLAPVRSKDATIMVHCTKCDWYDSFDMAVTNPDPVTSEEI